MVAHQQVWTHWLRYKAASDVGLRRGNNQDSYAVHLAADRDQWERQGHLFLIADGMGAHAAGELASKLAADHVPLIYQKQDDSSPPEGLEKALHGANLEIFRRGQENLDFYEMGTTCSVLLLLPQGAIVGHVGDSRVYRLRGTTLSQLTFDHSMVWEMQRGSGLPPSDDSAALPGIGRNVITRCLGPKAGITVDLEGPFPIEVGDTFLLCSDGLTGPLADNEIASVLNALEPKQAAQMLIDLANMHGGPDNITVIVCRVTGPEMATPNRPNLPLTVGREEQRRDVHPAAWVTICVLALSAAVLLATGRPLPAAVVLSTAVVSALAAIAIRFNVFGDPGVALSGEQQLGQGPYRQTAELSIRDFCHHLADKLQAARTTVDSRDWQMDWSLFDEHQQAAKGLVAGGQETEAVGVYAQAVHLLVSQAREKLKSQASDT